ncbi:uncharacterized protein [Euwallacea similis]|uniref:uncharacterized protein n=1 Tax=Euwallacea similis TaxID=1736056 RepID=UPI00344DCFFB
MGVTWGSLWGRNPPRREGCHSWCSRAVCGGGRTEEKTRYREGRGEEQGGDPSCSGDGIPESEETGGAGSGGKRGNAPLLSGRDWGEWAKSATSKEEEAICVTREEEMTYRDALKRGEVLLTVPKGGKGERLRDLLIKELGGGVYGGDWAAGGLPSVLPGWSDHRGGGGRGGSDRGGSGAGAATAAEPPTQLQELPNGHHPSGGRGSSKRAEGDGPPGRHLAMSTEKETGHWALLPMLRRGPQGGGMQGGGPLAALREVRAGGPKATNCRAERYCPLCKKGGIAPGDLGASPSPRENARLMGSPRPKGNPYGWGRDPGDPDEEAETDGGLHPQDGAGGGRLPIYQLPAVSGGRWRGRRRRKDGERLGVDTGECA